MTHNRGQCLSEAPVIACTSCYRMHFFTTNCICKSPVFEPGQALRMCGPQLGRPFMDVTILSVPIPALINTTLTQTQIDVKVAKHIMSLLCDEPTEIPKEMDVPFTQGTNSTTLRCKVGDFDERDVHIHLGMDFLLRQHLRLKSGGVTLYGHSRWSTDHPNDVQFAYNAPYGKHLKAHLKRLDFPMMPKYSRRTLPDGTRRKYFSRCRDDPRQ